ncbi:hypothetical protein Cni_G25672 [Canna indica]|uniref:Peptidase A1 domain-containing protein n=1 Tax=Canna indica TaxID=4628 RepID=A0AAQ3KY57_9LILI|nr:hypothetical protein Cni_G25672 [Canna indica]
MLPDSFLFLNKNFPFGTLSSDHDIESTVASIAFGCGSSNNGVGFSEAAGFVGLGRGKLSLISQLGILTFSFCFTSFGSPKKGSLLLGSLPPSANPNSSSPPSTVSTPILLNSFRPSFYYISLKGITIGTTRLDIPSSAFAIRNDGSGGMIIDSGTSITFLEYAAYAKGEEAFSSQIKNLRVRVSSFRGTICLRITPHPNNQLRFGFTSMPKIDWNVESTVGEHEIKIEAVTSLFKELSEKAINKSLDFSNCGCICIDDNDYWIPIIKAFIQ